MVKKCWNALPQMGVQSWGERIVTVAMRKRVIVMLKLGKAWVHGRTRVRMAENGRRILENERDSHEIGRGGCESFRGLDSGSRLFWRRIKLIVMVQCAGLRDEEDFVYRRGRWR
jgi:hypothetical protein